MQLPFIKPDYAFYFKLPSDCLSLWFVKFTEEKRPELRFVASPKVPTIQEEDLATICRLFPKINGQIFFVGFPNNHSRCFREYSPLGCWTSVGDLLFKVDWNMKDLYVGVRSNEQFQSWPLLSNLTGLATHIDFPKDML